MFDKNKFATILKEILEKYSNQNEFAHKANIGRAYISRILNMRLNVPPKPSTLQGIANASKDITTYEELMQVCGYLDLGIKLDKENNKTIDSTIAEKVFTENINKLNNFNLTKEQILELMDIFSKNDDFHHSIESQINNFVFYNFGKNVNMYDVLLSIYEEIKYTKNNYKKGILNDDKELLKSKYGIDSIQLLDNYSKLNNLGKKTANQRVEELTEMPKYTEKNELSEENTT